MGRYEVGDDEATAKRDENSGISSTPVEMQGKYVYNCINWYDAYDLCKRLSGTNENVETCLMYSCLWDAILEYLEKSGNKTYYEISVDSSSWGNCYSSTFEYTNVDGETKVKNKWSAEIVPTGSTEYTKSCNLYDIAGNVGEWTQESSATTSSFKSMRGGSSTYTYPASRKAGGYAYTRNGACRAILYIK